VRANCRHAGLCAGCNIRDQDACSEQRNVSTNFAVTAPVGPPLRSTQAWPRRENSPSRRKPRCKLAACQAMTICINPRTMLSASNWSSGVMAVIVVPMTVATPRASYHPRNSRSRCQTAQGGQRRVRLTGENRLNVYAAAAGRQGLAVFVKLRVHSGEVRLLERHSRPRLWHRKRGGRQPGLPL